MHLGQFLTPDSQIRTSCSKNPSFHFRLVMYYFFAPYNNRKSFKLSTICSNRKCSKVVGTSSEIFGSGSDVFRNPGHNETRISRSLKKLAGIECFYKNVTAAMLVSQTKPLGIELYFYANSFFCFSKPIWPIVK